MMKIVIDTYCLLASIPPKSSYYWLYSAFEKELFEWVVSNEILTEYEEQITKKYSALTADLVLSILATAPNTVFVEPFFKWNLILDDVDDNKFVDVAIASGSHYLVTNDTDFNILKSVPFPKVNVVNLSDFNRILFT